MHHLSREERRASARPEIVLLFKQCSLQKHDTRAEWKAKTHCRWCDKGQKEHCWKVEGCIERGCLWLYLDAKTYQICSCSINHIYLKLIGLFVLYHEGMSLILSTSKLFSCVFLKQPHLWISQHFQPCFTSHALLHPHWPLQSLPVWIQFALPWA